ncbi:hypothetical protein SETIT_3G107800v2 [Setaria italica]|uniref:Uncharacterized protein n=1 Tax=Setaria italica TaxID=4555 RepID=K3Z6W7_SETIT|nr:protein SLOW GREEN 1, chloroplastic [Setaria italica]RCV16069.1 hypothetical protein SETIT_3G107800v2 [Setaria italica]
MAMSFILLTTTPVASASLLPIRRQLAAGPSLSFPLKPHRFPSRFRIPPKPPRFSRGPSVSPSCEAPTVSALSPVASTSRTLLFLLAAGLLSLSGIRPLPALASAPPPTQQPQEIEGQDEQQPQEIEGQDEQQESEERKEQVEDQVEKAEVKENEEQQEDEEEEDDDEVRMYSAILSRDPGDVDTLKCALYAKMRRADWGGALRYTRRLRDAEPGEVEWRLMEAQLHELKGDLAEAERQFRGVLAEEPLLIRALHGLAICMQKKHEGPAGFEMLDNALQLAASDKRVPEERNIKLLIAQMHVVMGQLGIASEKLQNLINEDPRDFRPHLCQGIVYALLDRKEDADKQFDIYRSLVPDEFPDKSFINDVILAARMESNDRIQKEFGTEFLSKK